MPPPSPPGRVVSPGGLPGPSGGSIYNERVAQQWGTTVEYLPGHWPFPDGVDRARLMGALFRASDDGHEPVLLDGLIGCAAPREVHQARSAGLRVVILVHLPLPAETGLTPSEQQQLTTLETASLQYASAVACTSSWSARDLGHRYGVRDVTVAEPGTDPRPCAVGSHPAQLITPASYTPRKNHRFLMEALASPGLADLSWHALWLGADPTGGARERLAADVAAAGLHDRVTLSGARSGTDLEDAWARSDLLLLPSLAETYAMVVSEALASGIPAVVGAGTAAEDTLRGSAHPARQSGEASMPNVSMPGAALATDDPLAWSATIARWLTSNTVRDRWRRCAVDRRDRLSSWGVPAGILATLMRAS